MATTEEKALEQTLQGKGLTATRVTPAQIDNIIVGKLFFTAGEGVIGASIAASVQAGNGPVLEAGLEDVVEKTRRTTICVLLLANGGQVVGVNYCPVSVENWNQDVARDLAEKDARNKLWELEGYVLRQRHHEQRQEENEIASALADFQESDCDGCKI